MKEIGGMKLIHCQFLPDFGLSGARPSSPDLPKLCLETIYFRRLAYGCRTYLLEGKADEFQGNVSHCQVFFSNEVCDPTCYLAEKGMVLLLSPRKKEEMEHKSHTAGELLHKPGGQEHLMRSGLPGILWLRLCLSFSLLSIAGELELPQ